MKLARIKISWIVAFTFLLLLSFPAYAWIFGPSNYDECVAKYTKNTESDKAVKLIAIACRLKFKERENIEYADCLLKHVPGIVSDKAATIVQIACKLKHIEKRRVAFADCVLANVPEVKSNSAAAIITGSCNSRYP